LTNECDKLTPFVDAGKAVFGVEYKPRVPAFCPEANAMNFNFLREALPEGMAGRVSLIARGAS
jgi:hypothetical protein